MNRQRSHQGPLNGGPLVLGVDFDNTIVSYDELLHRLALERGLISSGVGKSKMAVRDTVRKIPDGEIQWQRLQGSVYGPMMKEAQLCEGVGNFLHECRRRGIKVFIVSHKTEFANYDETQTNLRQAATKWMAGNGFFEGGGFGLSLEDIFFEGTRRDKLQRVAQLGCTHFIDDLKEVFDDAEFPDTVHKILYAPDQLESYLPEATVAASWEEIREYFFGPNDFNSGFAVRLSSNESTR